MRNPGRGINAPRKTRLSSVQTVAPRAPGAGVAPVTPGEKVRHRGIPHPGARLPRTPLPAGFFSYMLGSFRDAFERCRKVTNHLCHAAAALNLAVLAGIQFFAGVSAASRLFARGAALGFLSLALLLRLCNRKPLDGQPRRVRGGDLLGAVVLLLLLVNSVYAFGTPHWGPASLSGGWGAAAFLGCVNIFLLGGALLGWLGPLHFPLRVLAGASVRAVILRHFMPVAVALVLAFAALRLLPLGRPQVLLASFLLLVLSLAAVAYLAVRSAHVIARRIEGSLKESEERYTILVDSLKDHAVLLLDPFGHIVTWNAGAEKIHGYGAEEVLGDSVSRFYPPEDRESGTMEDTFKSAVLLGSHEKQEWRVKKDGARFWAETVTEAFMDDKKTLLGFSQVLRDITSRKRAEDAVVERETYMQILQAVTAACNAAETLEEALPVVLSQVCMRTGWPVGHAWDSVEGGREFVSGPWYVSDEARFALFRAHSDRLRFPRDKGLPAQVLASGKAQWTPDLAADKEFPHQREVQGVRLAAGYAFPVKMHGKVLAILVFFSEQVGVPSTPCREALEAICVQLERVAERERAERSLRTSELRFRSVAQTANDAIVSYDDAGVVSGWNRGAKTIFGFDEGDILGRSLGLIVPDPSPSGGSPAGFPGDFLTDIAGKTREFAGLRKSGEIFPVEVSIAAWKNGGSAFFTAIMRDVTAHKKAQHVLTASLREKEAMLKEIHHRVKNNLQMVSSLLHLQSEKIRDPSLLAIFLESQNRVRSMAIIHECLYESPDLAHLDFSDYVEKLTDNLLRTYSLHPEKNVLRLSVDRVALDLDVAIPCGLIITELVSNALKYAYPEGQEGLIHVKFRVLPENRYELTVADEGVGLPGPLNFDSIDSLGLRLVQILTEQLEGRIRVENAPGASFIIEFKDPGKKS